VTPTLTLPLEGGRIKVGVEVTQERLTPMVRFRVIDERNVLQLLRGAFLLTPISHSDKQLKAELIHTSESSSKAKGMVLLQRESGVREASF